MNKTVFLEDLVNATFEEELIKDYVSPVTGNRGGLKRSFHLASFPDYLIVQMKVKNLLDLIFLAFWLHYGRTSKIAFGS